jgi:hypothetical protein
MLRATLADDALPRSDPLAFLEASVARFEQQDLNGYQLVLEKQERIGGTLYPPEVIDMAVRMKPHSVLMRWRSGERKAHSVLYVEGENHNQLLVHPSGLIGALVPSVAIDPDGPQAHSSSLFGIRESGLRNTLRRTLQAWRDARDQGTLQVQFLGTHNVPEVGDRPCYVLRQQGTGGPDGATTLTISIDRDTWLQVGTVLTGAEDELFGKYYYRDIVLNPAFAPDQFRPAALVR